MIFTDIILITDDMPRLIDFYENIFEIDITKNEVHTQFDVGNIKITLYSRQAAESDMGFNFCNHNGNGKTIIAFNVNEIDDEINRLKHLNVQFVTDPKTYPWGATALHFRDPDGNIICFRSWVK